jgi:hypothetical protein
MGDAEGKDGSMGVDRGGFGKEISQVEDTREERNTEFELAGGVHRGHEYVQ